MIINNLSLSLSHPQRNRVITRHPARTEDASEILKNPSRIPRIPEKPQRSLEMSQKSQKSFRKSLKKSQRILRNPSRIPQESQRIFRNPQKFITNPKESTEILRNPSRNPKNPSFLSISTSQASAASAASGVRMKAIELLFPGAGGRIRIFVPSSEKRQVEGLIVPKYSDAPLTV